MATTPRASGTGFGSGPSTVSASCSAGSRCGSTPAAVACRAGTARLRHPRHPRIAAYLTPDIAQVRPLPGSSSPRTMIAKEFALLRLRTEPRHHQPDRRSMEKKSARRGSPPPAVEAFKKHAEPTSSSPTICRPRGRHEQADRRNAARLCAAARYADPAARRGDHQPLQQGRAGQRHSQQPPVPRRPAHPNRQTPQDPRPRVRAADRRQVACHHPQDAWRHPDRSRRTCPRRASSNRSPACTPPAEAAGLGGRRRARVQRPRSAPSSAAASSPETSSRSTIACPTSSASKTSGAKV